MPILDGQEITSLKQMIDKFQKDPRLGRTTLRVEARWNDRLETRVVPSTKIEGSGGDCLYAEELLEVLAKCVVFDVLGHADHQGVNIQALGLDVEGDIDFAGSVGLDAPAAFQTLRLQIQAETDASDPELTKLVDTVRNVSIVGRSLEAVPQEYTIAKTKQVVS